LRISCGSASIFPPKQAWETQPSEGPCPRAL
jgi:hypothetical protein